MAISAMTDALSSFEKLHKNCPKTWKEPEPDLTRPIEERIKWWVDLGEHGISSQTIWNVIVLRYKYLSAIEFNHHTLSEVLLPPVNYRSPVDPDDFRRCYLLLKAIPEWKEKLISLKEISPVWSNIVDNWDKLCEMLEEQMATKKANGMYEFMKSLGC
jgi:hypothetical protein